MDGTPLEREIELWDSAGAQAAIWVHVATIFGNDSTQFLVAYWGNDRIAGAPDTQKVFENRSGFAGVWHLGSPAGDIVADATGNGNNGEAIATGTVPGIIGMAQSFDGASSLIRVSGPADSILNFQEDEDFTVSAWVKTLLLDTVYQGIVYKSNFQYGLQIRPEEVWEFFTFVEGAGWQGSRFPLTVDSWHYLAGIRKQGQQYLYLDGQCVDSGIVEKSSDAAGVYDVALEIGHCPDGGQEPGRYFKGSIDEVRISGIAESGDWIRLCYMNQREDEALIQW